MSTSGAERHIQWHVDDWQYPRLLAVEGTIQIPGLPRSFRETVSVPFEASETVWREAFRTITERLLQRVYETRESLNAWFAQDEVGG